MQLFYNNRKIDFWFDFISGTVELRKKRYSLAVFKLYIIFNVYIFSYEWSLPPLNKKGLFNTDVFGTIKQVVVCNKDNYKPILNVTSLLPRINLYSMLLTNNIPAK